MLVKHQEQFMATTTYSSYEDVSEREYNRRIRAWTMYDWANSAFATTILAVVLPVYYSQVAGATLPSASTATAYWSIGLSVSLFIVALMSPLLGTISDVMRGKKRFLAVFFGMGVVATGLLVFVKTGDWLLASILFIVGRIGFTAANVFYDALLPHIARKQDLDSVSARGFAMGYLGGGILLAINVVMLQYLPGTWGPRLSFLSVAMWWGIFAIPLFRRIPEPPAATAKLQSGENVVGVSARRIWATLKDVQQYRELFKYLIAFLIYADGIGTIIGVAAIYGAELGFGSVELILALLLVQFVGIPYSLIFGKLPSPNQKHRPFFLAFILFNIVALPLTGVLATRILPSNIVGVVPEPFVQTPNAAGEGIHSVGNNHFVYTGEWAKLIIPADELDLDNDAVYRQTTSSGDEFEFIYNGQHITILYSIGPDHGVWLLKLDDDEPLRIDAYNPTFRYGVEQTIEVKTPGEHTLSLVNSGETNPDSAGNLMSITAITVEPPIRSSNLIYILGLIILVELLGLLLSLLLGRPLFAGVIDKVDTKTSILIALSTYAVIAIWGYFLNSVVEFWFLAWMVAVVQGGSQALSRSLFSSMAPAAKSGEFFGLFGVMEKFSAIVGPLIFAFAATTLGSSRPAVLSIIAFFIIGGFLLLRVNVAEGRQVAREEDERLLGVEAR
jgi:UMF1 family MFS transporter